MKKTLFRPLAAGLALALATGFSGAVLAAPQSAPGVESPAPRHGGDRHHGPKGEHRQMMRDALFLPGLGPVPKAQIDALKLTADQQKQVDAYRSTQREAFQKMRAERDARSAILDKQLADNKLDPRALSQAAEQARESSRAGRVDAEKQGFAIWDSFNDAQRAQLTSFVKARHEKMAERRQQRQEKDSASVRPTT